MKSAGAFQAYRILSERCEQLSIDLLRMTDDDEAHVLHVRLRYALYIGWRYRLRPFDEGESVAPTSTGEFPRTELRRLPCVSLLPQPVTGDVLIHRLLQARRG